MQAKVIFNKINNQKVTIILFKSSIVAWPQSPRVPFSSFHLIYNIKNKMINNKNKLDKNLYQLHNLIRFVTCKDCRRDNAF